MTTQALQVGSNPELLAEPDPHQPPPTIRPLPRHVGETRPLTYIDGRTTTYTVLDEIIRISKTGTAAISAARRLWPEPS